MLGKIEAGVEPTVLRYSGGRGAFELGKHARYYPLLHKECLLSGQQRYATIDAKVQARSLAM